jgi:hypothetical protein
MPRKTYTKLRGKREPFVVELSDGSEITLPLDAPAHVIIDMRARILEDEELTDREAERIGYKAIEEIVGREDYVRILRDIGLENAPEFIGDVMNYYLDILKDTDAEAEGKAPAGAESPSPSTTSSTTGEPSTLTSRQFGLVRGGISTEESSPGPASSVG